MIPDQLVWRAALDGVVEVELATWLRACANGSL
jgi:hypothetical protein